jgi:hypothetical protein
MSGNDGAIVSPPPSEGCSLRSRRELEESASGTQWAHQTLSRSQWWALWQITVKLWGVCLKTLDRILAWPLPQLHSTLQHPVPKHCAHVPLQSVPQKPKPLAYPPSLLGKLQVPQVENLIFLVFVPLGLKLPPNPSTSCWAEMIKNLICGKNGVGQVTDFKRKKTLSRVFTLSKISWTHGVIPMCSPLRESFIPA